MCRFGRSIWSKHLRFSYPTERFLRDATVTVFNRDSPYKPLWTRRFKPWPFYPLVHRWRSRFAIDFGSRITIPKRSPAELPGNHIFSVGDPTFPQLLPPKTQVTDTQLRILSQQRPDDWCKGLGNNKRTRGKNIGENHGKNSWEKRDATCPCRLYNCKI